MHYSNHQWTVDESGLTSTPPGAPYEYFIEASRLIEREVSGDQFYRWPKQLGKKNWIDMNAFVEAYRKAITLHAAKFVEPIDPVLLELSIEDGYTYTK